MKNKKYIIKIDYREIKGIASMRIWINGKKSRKLPRNLSLWITRDLMEELLESKAKK